jgi:tripeptidyl-peptidase-1
MIGLSTVFLASLLAVASASPTPRSNMIVRANKSAPPPGFAFDRVAQPDQTIPLRIALVSKDLAGLEKVVYDVSTPGSASYGKHLSKEQVSVGYERMGF